MSTAARADRLAELLDVRYLTGFTGTNGACVVSAEERLFLTDFRYVEQAGAQVGDFELLPAGRDLAGDLAQRLRGRAGFDDTQMSVRTHAKLAEGVAEGVELVAAGRLVGRLRQVKDSDELRRIAAATELATGALERTLERGLAGRTERAVALELERTMVDSGAEAPSFPAIVAAGRHAALPHAEPRDVEIPAGTLVVIDWGARLDGYCSDCTRTVASGGIDGRAHELYELVRRAQHLGLGAVRAGAQGRSVDGVAREAIEAAGHGDRFGHGLGHGVGLEVHEGPTLTARSDDVLAVGNVVSVEPGVYLPGELGVRIEDLVAVTDDGADVLTAFTKELVTAG